MILRIFCAERFQIDFVLIQNQSFVNVFFIICLKETFLIFESAEIGKSELSFSLFQNLYLL